MDENQKKLIKEQMQKIPSEVREAIESSDWERKIFNIGRAHKLHIDDIDVLSMETILTMIGLEHPKDFFDNVKERAEISEDVLLDIIDEVNEQLFTKIRDALKVHYEKVSAGEIMDDEEKDELHHAGISIDENHQPRTEKKTLETLVDRRLKEVKAEKPKVSESQPKEEEPKTPKIEEKPKRTFDPYREPIE